MIRPSAARSEVSGVRNSCETVEMNSSFMRSRARRSVVSVNATTTPTALPASVPSADWVSIWGRATYSTGKLVPSLRQKTSLETRTVSRSRMEFWMGHSSCGYGVPSAVSVMDEVVYVSAEDLFGLVADHLGGGGVDDGAVAIEVDAVDTVADRLQNGVGLAAEGAQLVLCADLFGDVDAEAEDVGVASGDFNELVAVCDDADFAVDVAEMEQAPGHRPCGRRR